MDSKIKKVTGSDLNIDFSNINFGNSQCPWDIGNKTNEHKCAFKDNVCEFFCGVKYLDSVLCNYPHKNFDEINELIGGNIGMTPKISKCPWNEKDKTDEHVCGLRDISLCKYFCGIKKSDVLCSYPYENLSVLKRDEIDRDMTP